MLVLGVDTGRHGAFVALNEVGRIVHRAVFEEGEHGIDFQAYLGGLKSIATPKTHAFVEDVHAIFGASAKSTFTFGRNFQIALDGLMAINIPFTLVKPKEWQKDFFTSLTPIYKKNTDYKLDTKAMAEVIALRHYKREKLLKTTKSKRCHEGLVDAALIANYGLRQIKQGVK